MKVSTAFFWTESAELRIIATTPEYKAAEYSLAVVEVLSWFVINSDGTVLLDGITALTPRCKEFRHKLALHIPLVWSQLFGGTAGLLCAVLRQRMWPRK
jgi:hypothetical protein